MHKRETQICVLNDEGSVVVERRILTEPERPRKTFEELHPGKVLLGASTESERVARCVEKAGREVIVADPNFAAMYATRSRKVKADNGTRGPWRRRAGTAPFARRIT